MSFRNLLLYFFSLFTSISYCQGYEGRECNCCGNESLYDIPNKDTLFISIDNGNDGVTDMWASSFLKASGAQPPKTTIQDLYKAYDIDDPSEIDRVEKQLIDYHKWTCKYAASNLRDNNIGTAWVEGKSGDGIGEIVLCEIDINSPSEIHAGFGKSEKLYQANNRPKNIKVYLFKVMKVNYHQYGSMYSTLIKQSEITCELKDINAFQPLPIGKPNHIVDSQYLIAIEIIDVYKGTYYDDTCISEIGSRK